MSRSPNLCTFEPQVCLSQESGRVLIDVELRDPSVFLSGQVSYPYSPESKLRDHENGQAEITRVAIASYLDTSHAHEVLNTIFPTFLRSVISFSAKTLTFKLKEDAPLWLIQGIFALVELNGLEIEKITIPSPKFRSTVAKDMFKNYSKRYLPAEIEIKISRTGAIRSRIYTALHP